MRLIDVVRPLTTFDLIPKHYFWIDFAITFNQLFRNLSSLSNKTIYAEKIAQISPIITQLVALQNDLIFSVKAVELPEISVIEEDVEVGTTRISEVGGTQINSDLVIEFYSATNLAFKNHYYLWLQLIFDLNTNGSLPRGFYESDIKIYELNRNGRLIETRIYHGCSPRNLDRNRFDVDENGFLESTVLTYKVNNGLTIIN